MKWILWLLATFIIGYLALRVTLAAVISYKMGWVRGADWWGTVTTYGVADMVEALRLNPEHPSND